MQKRFYFPSTGTSPINPAFGTGWNKTSSAVRRPLQLTPSGTAMTEFSSTSGAASPEFHLVGQFTSGPLAAQTISAGNAKGQFVNRLNSTSLAGVPAIAARIVSGDGLTIRGHLIGPTPDCYGPTPTTDPPRMSAAGTGRNRPFLHTDATAVLPYAGVSVQAGDRLVIEPGFRDESTGTSHLGYLWFGDNAIDDLLEVLPDGTGTSTKNNPWVEFEHDFVFQIADPRWRGEYQDMIIKPWLNRTYAP